MLRFLSYLYDQKVQKKKSGTTCTRTGRNNKSNMMNIKKKHIIELNTVFICKYDRHIVDM